MHCIDLLSCRVEHKIHIENSLVTSTTGSLSWLIYCWAIVYHMSLDRQGWKLHLQWYVEGYDGNMVIADILVSVVTHFSKV